MTKKKVAYALVSVSDKKNLVPFCQVLVDTGYRIISTGGTSNVLSKHNIPLIPIREISKNPESFDGRMKTISFQVESGILFDRDNPKHRKEAKDLHIVPIDIVVCNLYPFEQTVEKKGVALSQAVEAIDVGGPTMIRAAAKNFKHVLVVVDTNDYDKVEDAIKKNKTTDALRKSLAAKAFYHLSFYDAQIAHFLSDELFPEEIALPGRKILDLRYGDNPHQKGAFYQKPYAKTPLRSLTKRFGRELSLTNLTDINAGLEAVRLFTEPAAAVIKHNSPCGIALGTTAKEALDRAIESDPESAFGGVIVLNTTLDMKASRVVATFKKQGRGNFDIIACPDIDDKTISFLSTLRKTMGIYTFGKIIESDDLNMKWLDGGFVLQTQDNLTKKSFTDWKVVTKKKPSAKQISQMQIAWEFLSRIRSNAVIVVDTSIPMTRGIGSGQTSRVKSTKIALDQAGKYTKNAILASDSFFPFPDSIELAAKRGILGVVQQGGSINDQASINAADRAGITMVFTHRRAFWH